MSKHREIKKKRSIHFVPYAHWGKGKTGLDKFIQTDKANNQYSDTLEYRLWHGGIKSQAYLLKSFPVLKLGQISLQNRVLISPRNLDFVDLDELVVMGYFHGSCATEINFSSCRNLTLDRASLHYVSFRHCEVDKFRCTRGSMQDFLFEYCSLNNFSCSESNINGLEIHHSRFSSPLIERTEIQRIKKVGSGL